jgi:hypothetical protein
MDKLVMMSILVATVAGPVAFARDASPIRGLKRTLLFMFVFQLLYVAYVTVVHTTYHVPQRPRW